MVTAEAEAAGDGNRREHDGVLKIVNYMLGLGFFELFRGGLRDRRGAPPDSNLATGPTDQTNILFSLRASAPPIGHAVASGVELRDLVLRRDR